MTPAEQYANLRALAHGLGAVIGEAAATVSGFKTYLRVPSFETDWGPITFRNSDPSINLPDVQLVEWARKNMPHEVVEAKTRVVPEHTVTVPAGVRPSLLETLKGKGKKHGRFRIVGEQVVDHETGEVVEWATVVPGAPTPVFNMPDEAKERAEELVRGRLAQIAAAVRPEVGS